MRVGPIKHYETEPNKVFTVFNGKLYKSEAGRPWQEVPKPRDGDAGALRAHKRDRIDG